MNSITVSLEWAKKLEMAGWPQNENRYETTCFYWNHKKNADWWIGDADGWRRNLPFIDKSLSAPTAEEILRELPPEAPHPDIEHTGYFLEIVRVERPTENWQVQYRERESWRLWDSPEPQSADTLVNACAKMYVYLAENNLLNPSHS